MKRKTLIYRICGAAVLAGLAYLATAFNPGARLAISLIVGLPSFGLIIVSRINLGQSFAVRPKAKALVTTGLYKHIQHPMFTFLDVFLLSVIVVVGRPSLLLLWAALVTAHLIASRREEKVLADAFGDSYKAYVNRTWF